MSESILTTNAVANLNSRSTAGNHSSRGIRFLRSTVSLAQRWLADAPSFLRIRKQTSASPPVELLTPAPESRAILEVDDAAVQIISSAKAAWVISILTGVNFVGSISTGLVVIALPAIAQDLGLPPHLMLWLGSLVLSSLDK